MECSRVQDSVLISYECFKCDSIASKVVIISTENVTLSPMAT